VATEVAVRSQKLKPLHLLRVYTIKQLYFRFVDDFNVFGPVYQRHYLGRLVSKFQHFGEGESVRRARKLAKGNDR
jgi:hypothetical protein